MLGNGTPQRIARRACREHQSCFSGAVPRSPALQLHLDQAMPPVVSRRLGDNNVPQRSLTQPGAVSAFSGCSPTRQRYELFDFEVCGIIAHRSADQGIVA